MKSKFFLLALHCLATLMALRPGALLAATPLPHYSFAGTTVHDLVGSVDGVLVNGAQVQGGVLTMDGVAGYVHFPQNLVPLNPPFSVAFSAQERVPGFEVPPSNPEAPLIQGSDGNFYGTTAGGTGANRRVDCTARLHLSR